LEVPSDGQMCLPTDLVHARAQREGAVIELRCRGGSHLPRPFCAGSHAFPEAEEEGGRAGHQINQQLERSSIGSWRQLYLDAIIRWMIQL
jgi:hypothetical protein